MQKQRSNQYWGLRGKQFDWLETTHISLKLLDTPHRHFLCSARIEITTNRQGGQGAQKQHWEQRYELLNSEVKRYNRYRKMIKLSNSRLNIPKCLSSGKRHLIVHSWTVEQMLLEEWIQVTLSQRFLHEGRLNE